MSTLNSSQLKLVQQPISATSWGMTYFGNDTSQPYLYWLCDALS